MRFRILSLLTLSVSFFGCVPALIGEIDSVSPDAATATTSPLPSALINVRDEASAAIQAEASSQISGYASLGGSVYFIGKLGGPPTGTVGLYRIDTGASDAVLIKTLIKNTYLVSATTTPIVATSNLLFFLLLDDQGRQQLWTSDGTTSGTNIIAGAFPDDPAFVAYDLVATPLQVYFSAVTTAEGNELWVSDGTLGGTQPLDLIPGAGGIAPNSLQAFGNFVVFSAASDGAANFEPWLSNGTVIGTFELLDIEAGATQSNPADFTVANGLVFFSAENAANGRELWKTDGTTPGTTQVANLNAGAANSDPDHLIEMNGFLYFTADNGADGHELWRTNGGAPSMLPESQPGADYDEVQNLGVANSRLHFFQIDIFNTSDTFLRSWAPAEGALTTTANITSLGATASFPDTKLIRLGSQVLFFAETPAEGWEPWISDGTLAGTHLLADVRAGAGSLVDPSGITLSTGTEVYFVGNDGITGSEPHWIDSSEATHSLDLTTTSGSYYFHVPLTVNGLTYLSVNDPTTGIEAWVSDGTTAGTRLLKDLKTGTGSGFPSYFYQLDATQVVFVSYYGGGGFDSEPHITDGTEAGTSLLKDIRTGAFGSNASSFTRLNDQLIFTANNGTEGFELWVTDGTTAGTTMVSDIYVGATGSSPSGFAQLGSEIYFFANDGVAGRELWKTDGTPGGTVLAADISGGAGSPFVESRQMYAVNGVLAMFADDGVDGEELWVTDGTVPGTINLDINPGAGSSTPNGMIVANNKIYFTADDGTNGRELWVSDGTPGGTSLVKNIAPGANSSSRIDHFMAIEFDNKLIFTATDETHGVELWITDGTTVGTTIIKDIELGSEGSHPHGLTLHQGTVYFSAFDSDHGYELWSTDGTSAGTVLASDLAPGEDGSYPASIRSVGSKLVFWARNPTQGNELHSH